MRSLTVYGKNYGFVGLYLKCAVIIQGNGKAINSNVLKNKMVLPKLEKVLLDAIRHIC